MKIKLLAVLQLLPLAAFAQGPLQPSSTVDPKTGPVAPLNGSGNPQPVMKTLHQVEPRIPLTAGSSGVTVSGSGNITISASGSYYLTADVTVPAGNGITVSAGPATVDLNGFNISTTSNPASGYGIQAVTTAFPVAILNGNILCSGTASSSAQTFSGAGFQYGIHCGQPYQSSITRVNISGASLFAIYADSSASSLVESCTVRNCVSGIVAATIVNSSATGISGNAIEGKMITGCFGSSYVGNGITGDTITGSDGRTAAPVNTVTAGISSVNGIVTNSRGQNGNPTTISNSKSISAKTASACLAVGESAIVNKYNMP